MSDFEYSIKKMFKEDIVSEWGRKKVRKLERKKERQECQRL